MDKERITDINFTVYGKIPKKYHVECESSLPDGKITIRLFEYDAQIALDEGEVTEETLTVTTVEPLADAGGFLLLRAKLARSPEEGIPCRDGPRTTIRRYSIH